MLESVDRISLVHPFSVVLSILFVICVVSKAIITFGSKQRLDITINMLNLVLSFELILPSDLCAYSPLY